MTKINPVDTTNECAYILAFLSHSLDAIPGKTPDAMPYAAHTGLSILLDQLSDRLFTLGSVTS